MIAKYDGKYFNVSFKTIPLRIWRYDPVEGFNKRVVDENLSVYEKYVMPDEAEQIFNVYFQAKWRDEWCGMECFFETQETQLITTNVTFAEDNEMEEFERATYWKIVPMYECDEFRIEVQDYLLKTQMFKIISIEELESYWKTFRDELMPPQ